MINLILQKYSKPDLFILIKTKTIWLYRILASACKNFVTNTQLKRVDFWHMNFKNDSDSRELIRRISTNLYYQLTWKCFQLIPYERAKIFQAKILKTESWISNPPQSEYTTNRLVLLSTRCCYQSKYRW